MKYFQIIMLIVSLVCCKGKKDIISENTLHINISEEPVFYMLTLFSHQ